MTAERCEEDGQSLEGDGHCGRCCSKQHLPQCHNPALKPVAQRFKERGKPHKLVIVAIARRLNTIANAVLKTGETSIAILRTRPNFGTVP